MALGSEQEVALLLFQTIILLVPIYLGVVKYITQNISDANKMNTIVLIGLIPLAYTVLFLAAWKLSYFLKASIGPSNEVRQAITLLRAFFVIVGFGIIIVSVEKLENPLYRAIALIESGVLLIVSMLFF